MIRKQKGVYTNLLTKPVLIISFWRHCTEQAPKAGVAITTGFSISGAEKV
jgi:hypothetical protein